MILCIQHVLQIRHHTNACLKQILRLCFADTLETIRLRRIAVLQLERLAVAHRMSLGQDRACAQHFITIHASVVHPMIVTVPFRKENANKIRNS